jgi:hypothetical protein
MQYEDSPVSQYSFSTFLNGGGNVDTENTDNTDNITGGMPVSQLLKCGFNGGGSGRDGGYKRFENLVVPVGLILEHGLQNNTIDTNEDVAVITNETMNDLLQSVIHSVGKEKKGGNSKRITRKKR